MRTSVCQQRPAARICAHVSRSNRAPTYRGGTKLCGVRGLRSIQLGTLPGNRVPSMTSSKIVGGSAAVGTGVSVTSVGCSVCQACNSSTGKPAAPGWQAAGDSQAPHSEATSPLSDSHGASAQKGSHAGLAAAWTTTRAIIRRILVRCGNDAAVNRSHDRAASSSRDAAGDRRRRPTSERPKAKFSSV